MKKHFYSLLAGTLISGFAAIAQDSSKTSPEVKTEKKEIIIQKKTKDGKGEKMVIVIDGENVTINGKPVKDFKGNFNLNDKNFEGDFDIHIAPEMLSKGRMIMRNLKMDQSNKAMLGVSFEKDDKGVKVTEVVQESAAEKAGIKKGDIITAINGDNISQENDLVRLIGKHNPEDIVDVKILRDGKENILKAQLSKKRMSDMAWNFNDDDIMPPLPPRMPKIPGMPHSFNFNDGNWPPSYLSHDKPRFGFSIKDNENGEGVKVTNIKDSSSAALAGLKENDLITEINGNAVKSIDEIKRQLAENKDKNEVSMKVLRNGNMQTILMKKPKKIKTADL